MSVKFCEGTNVLALLKLLLGQLRWFWNLRSNEKVRLTLGSFRTMLKHSSKCELLKASEQYTQNQRS